MKIAIRDLGLAAYIRLKEKEATFIEFKEDKYVFESERDEDSWRVEYLNSCCYRHDSEVMALRVFKQKAKRT
jgi:hypothetical protein